MNFLISSLRTLVFQNLHEATSHWISQRVSSVVLVPLTVIFMITFVQNIGLGYEQNILIYKSPTRAFLTFLFISLTLLHFKQGAQVVIEDYIHNNKINKFLLNMNTMFFWGTNFLSCFVLAKIVFEQNWS